MRSFLRSLFSEKSDVSMIRVMSLASLIIGAYLALKGQDSCVVIFVSAAFSGKVAQKFIESKKAS